MSWYEDLVEVGEKIEEWRKSARVVLPREEQNFEITKQGTLALLVSKEYLNSACSNMIMFMTDIPPDGHSGLHRHFNEAVIYILEGKGYSVVNDVRYDWKEGDVMCIPTYAWHQHFNEDPEKAARWLAVTIDPLMVNMGFSKFDQKKLGSSYEAQQEK